MSSGFPVSVHGSGHEWYVRETSDVDTFLGACTAGPFLAVSASLQDWLLVTYSRLLAMLPYRRLL